MAAKKSKKSKKGRKSGRKGPSAAAKKAYVANIHKGYARLHKVLKENDPAFLRNFHARQSAKASVSELERWSKGK
jgi:hypothetical protein